MAGSETTSKSLLYAIACLMRHPDVQTKLQADLDKLKSEGLVTTKQRGRLAYVEATTAEVWRTCNISPFGPPRHAHQAGLFDFCRTGLNRLGETGLNRQVSASRKWDQLAKT